MTNAEMLADFVPGNLTTGSRAGMETQEEAAKQRPHLGLPDRLHAPQVTRKRFDEEQGAAATVRPRVGDMHESVAEMRGSQVFVCERHVEVEMWGWGTWRR
jgi:hypothetical protein